MYSTTYRLCQYDNETVVTSNRHFLSPSAPIYVGMSNNIVNDRLNLKPSYWGPSAWKFLYSVAKGYGDTPSFQDKQKMRDFLSSLGYALPCQECRHNYDVEIKDINDADLESSATLTNWLRELEIEIENNKSSSQAEYNNEYNTEIESTIFQTAELEDENI